MLQWWAGVGCLNRRAPLWTRAIQYQGSVHHVFRIPRGKCVLNSEMPNSLWVGFLSLCPLWRKKTYDDDEKCALLYPPTLNSILSTAQDNKKAATHGSQALLGCFFLWQQQLLLFWHLVAKPTLALILTQMWPKCNQNMNVIIAVDATCLVFWLVLVDHFPETKIALITCHRSTHPVTYLFACHWHLPWRVPNGQSMSVTFNI